MHGEGFDALDRKRRVDDVIVMAWVGARILRGSNAIDVHVFTTACEEQERKKRFSTGMHGEGFDALDRKRRVDDIIVMAWVRARILRGSNAL